MSPVLRPTTQRGQEKRIRQRQHSLVINRVVAPHRVDLDRRVPASQRDCRVAGNAQPRRNHKVTQQVCRGDQNLVDRLAMIAQPGADVHRVAEIDDLPLRITALASEIVRAVREAEERMLRQLGLAEYAAPPKKPRPVLRVVRDDDTPSDA